MAIVGWMILASQAPPARAQSARERRLPEGEIFGHRLGITFRLVPYDRSYGAQLTRDPVPGTAAHRAGLERGDTLVYFDNRPIYTAEDLLRTSAKTTITFVDGATGVLRDKTIYLPPLTGLFPPPEPPPPYVLGVSVAETTLPTSGDPRLTSAFGPTASQISSIKGLRIEGFTTHSTARDAGLEVGDVILKVNDQPTGELDDLKHALATCRGRLRVTLKESRPPFDVVSKMVYPQPTGGPSGPPPASPTRR